MSGSDASPQPRSGSFADRDRPAPDRSDVEDEAVKRWGCTCLVLLLVALSILWLFVLYALRGLGSCCG